MAAQPPRRCTWMPVPSPTFAVEPQTEESPVRTYRRDENLASAQFLHPTTDILTFDSRGTVSQHMSIRRAEVRGGLDKIHKAVSYDSPCLVREIKTNNRRPPTPTPSLRDCVDSLALMDSHPTKCEALRPLGALRLLHLTCVARLSSPRPPFPTHPICRHGQQTRPRYTKPRCGPGRFAVAISVSRKHDTIHRRP